jgi:hypothetical protein
MNNPDDLVLLRAEEIGGELAIRKQERRMVREQREMERDVKALEEAEVRAEREIEAEWRREHWGHEPERHPAWQTTDKERPNLSRLAPRNR